MNCHLFDKRNPKDAFNTKHGLTEGCYDYDEFHLALWEEWKSCIEFNRTHIDDLFLAMSQKDEVIARYWKSIDKHRENIIHNDMIMGKIIAHCSNIVEYAKKVKL